MGDRKMINKNNLVIIDLLDKGQIAENNGIFIEKDKTVINNDRILIETTRPEVDPEEFPKIPKVEPKQESNFILSVKAAKEIMSIIPKKPRLPICSNVVIEQHNGKASFSTTDLDTARTVHSTLIEGQYPEYKKIYPEGEPVFTIGLSAELLNKVCVIMDKFQSDCYKLVKFEFYGASQAVKFSTINSDTEQKLQGVIMPMSLNEEDY